MRIKTLFGPKNTFLDLKKDIIVFEIILGRYLYAFKIFIANFYFIFQMVKIRLNIEKFTVGSCYCEWLPNDLKNVSPEYREHPQCRAMVDKLDGQALCDVYQDRMMNIRVVGSLGTPPSKSCLIIS